MRGNGGSLKAQGFSCAALALLSVATFARKAVRANASSAGAAHAWAFWVASFLLYVAVVACAARRAGHSTPVQTRAEMLRIAGAGLLLAYFSLEVP